MPIDLNAPITWRCTTCHEPVDDGDGFLGIDPSLVVADRPARAPWFVLHQDCDPDPEGPGYWLDIEEIRTAAGLLDAHRRIGRKQWIQWTDWAQILDQHGVQP